MSPFYAAYLKQLIPSKDSKQNYADGGTVTTQRLQPQVSAQDTANPQAMGGQRPQSNLAGPTTLQNNSPTTSSGFGNFFTGNGVAQSSGLLGSKNSAASQALDYANQLNPLQALGDMLTNKFQASAAPIQSGTTQDQLNRSYDQSQGGLEAQQAMVNALNAQNGLGNQSNVFNQYADISQGGGPNPAQAMLRQQTGNNIANQAALMAGQRGSSANPGMMGRQAAQMGANIQQNAIGQGAALQAQQQLNALGNMGNIANTQVANQMAGTQGLNNAVQNEQNILQGANNANNANMVNMQNGMNSVNAGVAAGNQNAMGQLFGGAMSGLSSAGGMLSDEKVKENISNADPDLDKFLDSLSKKNYAAGGAVEPLKMSMPGSSVSGPQSAAGQWLSSSVNGAVSAAAPSFDPPKQTQWIADSKGGSSAPQAPSTGGAASSAAGIRPTGNSQYLQAGIGLAEGGEVEENSEGADMPPPPAEKAITQSTPQAEQVNTPAIDAGSTATVAPVTPGANPWLNSTVGDATSSSAPAYSQPAQTQWYQAPSGGGGGGGMMSSGAGMAAMMSDENQKSNKKGSDAEIDVMINKLEPKSYDYKNPNIPGTAPGRQYGVMAQDLEKSKAGASIVHDTPQGKMVDSAHGLTLALAAIGHLNDKIKSMEHELKMARGGRVPAMVSPEERYLDKADVKKVKAGANPMHVGEKIPGKAKVKGRIDTTKNDTVPKSLESGGIVIPRSVTKADDAPRRAQAFVEAIFMHKGVMPKRGKK